MKYADLPPAAFGRQEKPSDEELRFWRLIEERQPQDDESELVTFACGHRVCMVVPLPAAQEYAPCGQCINAFVEAARK